MELPTKILQQIALNTRPKNEERTLKVLDISTHEEHIFRPHQTNNKQFKIAFAFLTGYNGIFNVTKSNNRFYFKKKNINEDDFIQISIPQGAYEIESLNDEIKRIINGRSHYSEIDKEYPFTMKPNFSTLGSVLKTSPQGPSINFVFDDSIRNLQGFNETVLYKKN